MGSRVWLSSGTMEQMRQQGIAGMLKMRSNDPSVVFIKGAYLPIPRDSWDFQAAWDYEVCWERALCQTLT